VIQKAPGLSRLVTEMIQATGDTGTQWILDLCNGIVKEGSIPDDNTIQYNTKFVKRHVAVASEALANRSVKKQRRRRTNVL